MIDQINIILQSYLRRITATQKRKNNTFFKFATIPTTAAIDRSIRFKIF